MSDGKRVTSNGATFYRVTKSDPCAVCDHPDWCRRFDDGYTECMRVDNHRPTRSGGWLHWTETGTEPRGDWRDRIASIPPAAVEERAPIDPDLCDRVYRFLLDRCPLSDDHRHHVSNRGFSDDLIASGHYGSLTEAARDVVAATAVEAFGETIIGTVPGFSRKKDGTPSLFAHAGMLIPVVDDLGRIYRLRVRPDDETKQAEGKYRHVSSPECSSGANLHFAQPKTRNCQVVRVGITEGEIKANYAASRLNMTIISRPGVGVNADVIPALERLGATEVLILDDMDTTTNPAVAAHEARLTAELIDRGYGVWRGMWPEQFKGIDDALAAGIMPMLEPRPLIAPCADALAEKDRVIADLSQRLRDLGEFHSAYVSANKAPHLGQERATAAALVVDLSTVPVGEWKAMPHKRLAEQAGISERAVPRQIKTVQPIINEVVEIKKEWVPETVDRETGEIRGGHHMTFARLTTDRISALKVIATGVPEQGHKNGHGGTRLPCPECGDAGRKRRWVDHCATCDRVLETGETRVKPGNGQDVSFSRDTATEPGSGASAPTPTRTGQDVSFWLDPAAEPGDAGETRIKPRTCQDVMFSDDALSVSVLSPTTLAVSHNDEPDWLSAAPNPEPDNRPDDAPVNSIADAWLNGRAVPGLTISSARDALATADHVSDRETKHQIHAELGAHLELIAHQRGKVPVPKSDLDLEPGMRGRGHLLTSLRSPEVQAQIEAARHIQGGAE